MQNKKFYKLNIVRLLCVMLMFALTSFSFAFNKKTAYAADENLPVVTLQSKTGENSVHRGQTFKLDIVLTNNTNGLSALFLTIQTYDKTAFKLVNVEKGSALSSLVFDTTNATTSLGYENVDFVTGGFNLFWEGENSKDEGVIATLTFQSFITAELKDYDIKLSYQKNNTRVRYQEEIDVSIINSVVTLKTGEFEVVYKDWDGTELYRKDCLTDDIPSYPYQNPTRPTLEGKYTYTFAGWKGVVSTNINEITFQADYTQTAIEHTIFLYVDKGDGNGFQYYEDGNNAFNFDYNETIDWALFPVPTLESHNFEGWFTSSACTSKLTSPYMPDHDVTLYGYFSLNIRKEDIPKISIYHEQTVGDIAYVGVYMIKNTGLNSLVLYTDYDMDSLTLVGIEREDTIFQNMSFDHTHTDSETDYSVEDFKLLWNSSANSLETGKLIVLKFKLKDDLDYGNYLVNLTYNEETDATYIESDSSIWYTKLDISSGSVPIGLRYHWNESLGEDDDIDIDIVTEDGKPFNVELVVDDITKTTKKSLDSSYVSSVIGNDKKISAVYSSKLSLNDSDYDANTIVYVKIKLTEDQKECENLYLYSLDENGNIEYKSCEINNGYMSFSSNMISDWIIVCDKATVIDGQIGTNTFTLILLPTLLAIATMGTFLIYWGRKRKII